MSGLRRLTLAAACLASLASCGTGSSSASGTPAPQEAFRVKSGDMGDDDFGRIQDRYGSVNGALASEAGAQGRTIDGQYQGELARREFSTKNYEKKAFWGSKDYTKQVYGGGTDGGRFQKASREAGKGAREGRMMSREDARAFATREVEVEAARETARRGIDTPSDAETDIRRRVYQEPDILDENKRQALTVEDTKQMLGR